MVKEISLDLLDTQWPYTYTDHDRVIVRGIVIDDDLNFYFAHLERDDIFGKCSVIETSGGGVENSESLEEALKRELKEELGVNVEIICKLGVVSDYYNLIHRHNINHYFLCRIKSFGHAHRTEDEIKQFHLHKIKLSYEQSLIEYKKCSNSKLGHLIYNREFPILEKAGEIIFNISVKPLKNKK